MKPLIGVLFAFLLSSLSVVTFIPAIWSTGDDLTSIERQISSYESSLDTSKATTIAQASFEFRLNTVGFSASYQSIFNTWSFSNTQNGIQVKWKDVNVGFTLNNNSVPVRNIVVSLDPYLTRVTSISNQEITRNGAVKPLCNSPLRNSSGIPQPQNFCGPPPCGSLSGPSPNWAGFELAGSSSCSWRTVPVYEAKATWQVPYANQPSPGACFNRWCAITVWPGLVSYQGGRPTGLMQAGTFSGIYASPNQPYYYAWYQTPGMTNSIYCLWGPMSYGDTVTVDIVNQARDGGNAALYNMFIVDNTINQACSVPANQSSGAMGTPYFADFIVERPTYCDSWGSCSYVRLPYFQDFTMTGWMYYSGALQSIATPVSNQWYQSYIMNNGGWDNVHVGYDLSTSHILPSWLTSTGT